MPDPRPASGADRATRPIIATSINPFSGLDQQLRCFEAWAAFGDPVTFNVAGESDRLAAHGLPAASRAVLAPEETGAALFGKAVPRVQSVLQRLERMAKGRPVLLVNGDILPAMKSADPLDFWLAQAPATALTREDCDLAEAHDPTEHAPYRNGLDAFLFSPAALAAVNRSLARVPVAARMCFGIPGWDFLLGAVVRSEAIGGRIMDSTVLLHERHAQTYANVDEFAHYVPAMHALGAVDGAANSAETAAYAFFQTIVGDCAAAEPNAAIVRLGYYRRPARRTVSDAARDVCALMSRLAPFLQWNTGAFALSQLAERQLAETDFARIRTVLSAGAGTAHAFAEELAAIAFFLAVARIGGRPFEVRPGSAEALERRIIEEGDDPFMHRLRLARLFGDHLVRGRFDAALYDALALSCHNETERKLVGAIQIAVPLARAA